MKIKTHNKKRKMHKPILVVAIVLSAGLVLSLTYAFALKPQLDKPSDNNQSKNTSSDEQQAENLQTNPDDKTTAPNTDTPATPTTNEQSNKKQVQMVASTDQSNNTVFIRGGINYPVTGGTCYAQLSGPAGQSIRKDSTVLPGPGSTDCKTIAIPTSELTSGTWTFTLKYESDEYEGVSSEASFTL